MTRDERRYSGVSCLALAALSRLYQTETPRPLFCTALQYHAQRLVGTAWPAATAFSAPLYAQLSAAARSPAPDIRTLTHRDHAHGEADPKVSVPVLALLADRVAAHAQPAVSDMSRQRHLHYVGASGRQTTLRLA